MTHTTTLSIRVDDEIDKMLDELTVFYGKQAADLGLSFGRSDAVRVIIRAAYRDMQDKMAGRP